MKAGIQCATCGGTTAAEKERCDFCGNFLLRLAWLERVKSTSGSPQIREGAYYFRSLQRLYWLATFLGVVMMAVLYLLIFDDLSETELVMLSPIWFLLIVFGTCGMYAESAVRLILTKQANGFMEGLRETTLLLPVMVRLLVGVVFFPPLLLLNPDKIGSPLRLSAMTAGLWGFVLYLFLVGIFPSL